MAQLLNYFTGNNSLTYLTNTYSSQFSLNELSGIFYSFVTHPFAYYDT